MPIAPNGTRLRMAAGQLALGFGVNHLRTVSVGQMAVAAGYHWLSIDLEHGAMPLHEATQICMAALPTGITPLVRIAPGVLDIGTRALDNGAQGIIVPQVETAEEARRIADAFRHPPAGSRGWGGIAPQFGYQPPPLMQAQAALTQETLVVLVIETPRAVANATEIAAIEGIDVLLVGATDLTTQMGIPGQIGDPRLQAAFEAVGEACRLHGKTLGMGGVYDEVWSRRYLALGARFIAGGADHGFIMSAATARARFLEGLVRPAGASQA